MILDPAYVLTADERALMNNADTPRATRQLLYGRELRATAMAYAVAADAPGLRRDAARYLASEADRLTRESNWHIDHAHELEDAREGHLAAASAPVAAPAPAGRLNRSSGAKGTHPARPELLGHRRIPGITEAVPQYGPTCLDCGRTVRYATRGYPDRFWHSSGPAKPGDPRLGPRPPEWGKAIGAGMREANARRAARP